jgi:hypothetical protein
MNHPKGYSEYKVGAYEYDGIKLLKENVDKYPGGKQGVLDLLNTITIKQSGFPVVWEEKPIEKYYDLSQILAQMKDSVLNTEFKELCQSITSKFDDTGVIETLLEIAPKDFMHCRNQWYCWNGSKWEMNRVRVRVRIWSCYREILCF